MMLDAVTLESSGAPVVHVHRQRHGDRAFGVRRPFAIAFIDVQVIGDDAKLLASHPENFVVVNRVCRCICATLGRPWEAAICAGHEASSTAKLWNARHSQVWGAHASTRAGERVSRSRELFPDGRRLFVGQLHWFRIGHRYCRDCRKLTNTSSQRWSRSRSASGVVGPFAPSARMRHLSWSAFFAVMTRSTAHGARISHGSVRNSLGFT